MKLPLATQKMDNILHSIKLLEEMSKESTIDLNSMKNINNSIKFECILMENEISSLQNELNLLNESLEKYTGKKRFKYHGCKFTKEELLNQKTHLENRINTIKNFIITGNQVCSYEYV
jgi:hypothetical protein